MYYNYYFIFIYLHFSSVCSLWHTSIRIGRLTLPIMDRMITDVIATEAKYFNYYVKIDAGSY